MMARYMDGGSSINPAQFTNAGQSSQGLSSAIPPVQHEQDDEDDSEEEED